MTKPVLFSLSEDIAETQYLSRRLGNEKIECLGCHKKKLKIATLVYSHRCHRSNTVPDHVVRSKITRMSQSAHNKYHKRMATSTEVPTDKQATFTQEPPLDDN